MATPTYTIQRGETFSLALDTIDGTPADTSSIVARVRKLQPGKSQVLPTEPEAAAFSITTRAATGTLPAGWTLTLSAEKTLTMMPGNYHADAKVGIGSGFETTSHVLLIVKEPATL